MGPGAGARAGSSCGETPSQVLVLDTAWKLALGVLLTHSLSGFGAKRTLAQTVVLELVVDWLRFWDCF